MMIDILPPPATYAPNTVTRMMATPIRADTFAAPREGTLRPSVRRVNFLLTALDLHGAFKAEKQFGAALCRDRPRRPTGPGASGFDGRRAAACGNAAMDAAWGDEVSTHHGRSPPPAPFRPAD